MGKKYLLLGAFSLPLLFALLLLFQYWKFSQQNSIATEKSPGMIDAGIINAKLHIGSDFDILLHHILHPEASCKSPITLGGALYRKTKQIDGDKVLCTEPAKKLGDNCIVYSFGVNNEWSFEEAIQKKYGCKVYAFDPSMAAKDHLHSKDIWFYRMGLSDNNKDRVLSRNKTWKMNTFEGFKKQLNHTKDQIIDVVKMDIEGSEFTVLENMLDTGMLKNVNHLCVEIHLTAFPHWNRVYQMLKKIENEGLHLFNTRNNTIVGALSVPGEKNRKEFLLYELAWFRY